MPSPPAFIFSILLIDAITPLAFVAEHLFPNVAHEESEGAASLSLIFPSLKCSVVLPSAKYRYKT